MPRHSVPSLVLEDWHVASGKKFTLEQALKAYPLFDLSTRWGWVINAMHWLLYPWERCGGWAPVLIWMGAESLSPSGI